MAKYWSRAYSLFFVSVVLATAIADRCQIVLLNRCKAAYKDALDATSTSQGGPLLQAAGMTRKEFKTA